MIKGKYVGTINIDFSFNENEGFLAPIDKIEDVIRNEMSDMIKKILDDEFGRYALTLVKKQSADVWTE